MRTESTPGVACNSLVRMAQRAAGSTALPWIVGVAALAAMMLLEAGAHVLFFGRRSYVDALLSPDAHEVWMRTVITLLMIAVAWMWHASVKAKNRHTERVEAARSQLQELSATLAHDRNEAHRDLAFRLHDGVAQSLSAARMFLSSDLADGECLDPTVARSVARIIDRTIADCRDIAQELSPPALDEYGLLPALEALGHRIAIRAGVSVVVPVEAADIRLDRPVMLAAYDALAEYMSTAAANPSTRTIRVTTEDTGSRVAINVQWDAEDHEDLLLAGQRLGVFGAEVTRTVGAGNTTVTISAPLSPAA